MKRLKAEPIRTVIIGCGRVHKYHQLALSTLPAFSVEAVCDIDPHAAKRCSSAFNCDILSFEAIKQSKMDLAVISTPSGLHYHHAKSMLESGISVLVEKPVTLSTTELAHLIRIAALNQVEIFVVQQQRFLPSIQFLKTNLFRLGTIYAIQIHLFWSRPQSYYEQATWRGTKNMDGGLLFNQGVHSIDLLTWLFGNISSISGEMKTLARDIEVEDTAVFSATFESGALSTLTSTILCGEKNFEAGFTVVGEKGIVRLGGISFEKIELWDIPQSVPPDDLGRANDYVYENGHLNVYQELEHYFNDLQSSIVKAKEAFHTIACIEAFYKSCETGSKEKPLQIEKYS